MSCLMCAGTLSKEDRRLITYYKCQKCSAIFSLDAYGGSSYGQVLIEQSLKKHTVKIQTIRDTAYITFTGRTLVILAIVLAAAFMGREWFVGIPAIWQSAVLIVLFGCLYYGIATAICKTVVSIDKNFLTINTGPLPIGENQQLSIRDIAGFYCFEIRGKGGCYYGVSVLLEQSWGKKRAIFTLDYPLAAFYLAKYLQERIADLNSK